MGRSRGLVTFLAASLSLTGGIVAAAGLAEGNEATQPRCRPVRATIDLTHGTIEGNFGLDGTVLFVQESPGTPPATAPATSSVFSGALTITTERGELQVRETGMFSSRTGNPNGPVLSSWGDVLGGTDRYAGVTGDLFFAGHRGDGIFEVDVQGTLCRP